MNESTNQFNPSASQPVDPTALSLTDSAAQKVRRLIQQDFLKAFESVDVIAAPSAPTTAYKIGASLDPVEMYLGDIYTIAVNLAGLPAINAPVGFDKDQLPVGLQLIGNYWSESQLLSVVHQYQQATDWHTQRAAIAEENA